MAQNAGGETSTNAWLSADGGYPSCITRQKTTLPNTPTSPKHIIVRNYAAALNPVDIQIMNLPSSGWFSAAAKQPQGIGEDFAGIVLAAGSESGFAAGDEVFGIAMPMSGSSGMLQEFLSIDCASSVICKKPDAWSWEQAASLPLVWLTARTCAEAIRETAKAGSKVAVLGGSSSTGMYVVYLLREMGFEVLATCSARNVEFVKSMGADVVVDYNASDVPTELKKWGCAAIVDCVGGTSCLNIAPRYVTIVGDKTSRSTMGGKATYAWNPRMLLRWALGRLGLGVKYDCVNLELRKDWLEETLKLPTSKITIDSTFGFDKVKEAFERLNTGRARGKVVVTIHSD